MTSAVAAPSPSSIGHPVLRLVRAGLAVGTADALWASTITAIHGHSVSRLWQYLAATAFGNSMYTGGAATVALGLAIHFVVAFAWSAVFLVLLMRFARLRGILESPTGVFTLGAVYGPFIWIMMSFVILPVFTHKPGAVSVRWGIEALGHIAFVGLPMMWGLRRR
ncbi:MAG: hypothetical protein JWM95_2212 [Gemmatimonadetes bacterium]|nr:hypothetical protein [Gemmatimonadota bacterium]